MVRDVKAGSGIKERDYVLSRGLQKKKSVSFVNEASGLFSLYAAHPAAR